MAKLFKTIWNAKNQDAGMNQPNHGMAEEFVLIITTCIGKRMTR